MPGDEKPGEKKGRTKSNGKGHVKVHGRCRGNSGHDEFGTYGLEIFTSYCLACFGTNYMCVLFNFISLCRYQVQ
jgi:hypothetical protein